jgi:hypothetical protein
MAGAAGLCGKPPAGKACEVIRFIPLALRLKARVPAIRAFICQMDESSLIYTATKLASAQGNFVVVPSAD